MVLNGQHTCTIDFVSRIDEVPSGPRLSCYGGLQAVLRRDHRRYSTYCRQVECSHAHHYMVGVTIDPQGEVVDLNGAAQSHVRWVRNEEGSPDHLEVALWGCSPVCVLRRDHPDFNRIRQTLEEAALSGDLVWYATHSDPEVVMHGDESWIYSRIMDIRPVRPGTEWGPGKMKPPAGAGQAAGVTMRAGAGVQREEVGVGS